MDFNNNFKQKTRKVRETGINTMVYGKIPPQAKDLEEGVLGAILLERDAFDLAISILKADCFYVEAHKIIFKSMQSLANKSQPIDIMTVSEELRASGQLEVIGGSYYLTKLTNAVVSSAHIEAHAKIILQKYILREIIRVSGELINDAFEDMCDPLELLSQAQEQLSLTTDSYSFGDMVPINNVLVSAMQEIQKYRLENENNGGLSITGIPSGFAELDMATRGWQNGDLIYLAARPSVGKTAFVLNLLINAAKYLREKGNASVAVWSLEMRNLRLVLRMLAAASEIWLTKLQTGKMSDEDMNQLYKKGVQVLSRLNILFLEYTKVVGLLRLHPLTCH